MKLTRIKAHFHPFTQENNTRTNTLHMIPTREHPILMLPLVVRRETSRIMRCPHQMPHLNKSAPNPHIRMNIRMEAVTPPPYTSFLIRERSRNIQGNNMEYFSVEFFYIRNVLLFVADECCKQGPQRPSKAGMAVDK